MAATKLSRHYSRILKQWPTDLLRPTSAFSSLIEKRAAAVSSGSVNSATQSVEESRVNALYALLDDRFAKKYPLPAEMLKPEARPTHYTDLMKDIEDAPNRTVATSWWNKVSGKIRMK